MLLKLKSQRIKMKKVLNIVTIVLCVLFAGYTADSQTQLQNLAKQSNPKFEDVRNASEAIWKDIPVDQRKGWKQFKRWEYFWQSRLNPDGTFPNSNQLMNSIKSVQVQNQKSSDKMQGNVPQWKSLGPKVNPNSGSTELGIGRLNVIRFNPVNSKIIWAGSAGGGLWRSLNGGKNWETFAFTQFLSLGVSDIAISMSNPSTIYVATGDADGIGGGGGNSYSIGVIKSIDNGLTWEVTNLNYGFANQKLVSRLLVDPKNSNILLAATIEGIFKTTDGGASWARKSDNIYFKDMEFKPDDPNVIYSVTNGWSGTCTIFKSVDMGETWKQGYSVSGTSRIALAVTSANSNNVYAVCAASNSSFHSFLKSDDEGETWTNLYDNNKGVNLLGREDGTGNDRYVGQGWYDLCLAISPFDENEIFVGGVNIWKSTTGGSSWTLNAHWYGGQGGKPYVHADQHDLIYDENDGYLYSANDGGIDRTMDGGVKWTNFNNGMNITQYYRIACSAQDSNVIYGGAQDNGSHRYEKGTWTKVYGGDGMNCEVDWVDPLTAYVSLYNGALYRTTNGFSFSKMDITSEGGAWVTPFIISPINHFVLYAGFKNVWKSEDGGRKWSKLYSLNNNTTLRSLAAAPSDSNTIYAATYNTLWVTYDGGKSWTTIPNVPESISSIAVDPKNAKRFWLTNDGFNDKNKVFEYNGDTKTNISGNLPNLPVNCVTYQKDSPDRLYIGTDIGVYYSDYGSANWEPFGEGLPNLIVNDIEIHYGSSKLLIATYGRGVWETNIINCNLSEPQVKTIGKTVFCWGDSVILESVGDYQDLYWSTGEKTKRITVKESGDYNITIVDPSGCKASSKAIIVDVKSASPIQIKPIGKFPVCEGDVISLELNVPMGFNKYLWSTGDTIRRIKITQPGKYNVTATTSDGCFSTDSFEIIIYPRPEKPNIIRYWYKLLKASDALSFQWYLDGKIISGATDQILEIDKLGDYTVQISDKNGCTNTSELYNVISGVEENSIIGENVYIYPNPNDGNFDLTIKSDKMDNYKVSIQNILGLTIQELSFSIDKKWSGQIDLTKYSAGVYNVIIKNSFETKVLKVIKN